MWAVRVMGFPPFDLLSVSRAPRPGVHEAVEITRREEHSAASSNRTTHAASDRKSAGARQSREPHPIGSRLDPTRPQPDAIT